MTFTALSTLTALALVLTTAAVVVVLYWLRPPPARVVVPSTVIWARVLKERRRRSDFWRWLISMLLALAVGAILAVSVGKPVLDAFSGQTRRVVVVIDNSPTMRAVSGAGTRWELAVTKARELLGEGSVSSQFLVVDTGGQLPGTGFTTRARALQLLDGLEPQVRATARFPSGDASLTDAVAEADGTRTEVFFISDGVLVQDVPPGVTTLSVFEPVANVGITAFDLRPVPAEPTRNEGFLELVNHGSEPARVAVSIDGAGGASASRVVNLDPGQVLGESIDVDNFVSGPLRVLIDAPGDAFDLDNVAYAYLGTPRLVRTVLVTPGNAYLETLLDLDPRVALESVPASGYRPPADGDERPDLYIFDRFAPADAPPAPVLLFRPPGAAWLPEPTGEELVDLSLAGVEGDHPMLESVSLADVVVESAARFDPGEHRVVAGTAEQPILLAGESPLRWALLSFDLGASNFPLQSSFPIFLSNAVSWLASRDVVPAPLGTISIPARIAAVTDVRGEAVETRAVGNRTAFTADAPGLFTVRTGEGDHVITANLLSPAVSAVNGSIFAGQAADVGLVDSLTGSVSGAELWVVLVLLALGLVLVEWWTYHRRYTV